MTKTAPGTGRASGTRALTNLEKELTSLIGLGKAGLPIPKIIGVTKIGSQAAYVMERFAQGSKEIVRTINGRIKIVGNSKFLNAKSVEDLKQIRKIMIDKKMRIEDLQFLIGRDGRVVISDPLGFRLEGLDHLKSISIQFKNPAVKIEMQLQGKLI
jgi:hypothetical protein